MFLSRNNDYVYPCKPQLYHIKVGLSNMCVLARCLFLKEHVLHLTSINFKQYNNQTKVYLKKLVFIRVNNPCVSKLHHANYRSRAKTRMYSANVKEVLRERTTTILRSAGHRVHLT